MLVSTFPPLLMGCSFGRWGALRAVSCRTSWGTRVWLGGESSRGFWGMRCQCLWKAYSQLPCPKDREERPGHALSALQAIAKAALQLGPGEGCLRPGFLSVWAFRRGCGRGVVLFILTTGPASLCKAPAELSFLACQWEPAARASETPAQ